MKHLKTKLTAAISMLLVSAMMLTGVSFAWYTLSTNPEVTAITATAAANKNLEIALDNFYTTGAEIDSASQHTTAGGSQGSTTGNDYTWGNLIDISNQMAPGGTNAFELRPAEYVEDTGLQTFTYGDDGRIDEAIALTESAAYGAADESDAADDATDTGSQVNGVARIYRADSDTNYAFKVVYWLRTNAEDGDIDLTEATSRANNADDAGLADGQGSFISTAHYRAADAEEDEVDTYTNEAIHIAFKVTPYDGDGGAAGEAFWVADTDIVYGDVEDGKVLLSMADGKHIIEGAQKDISYKVEMFVFLNGDVVTNAMAEEAIDDIAVNVQFSSTAVSNAMKY